MVTESTAAPKTQPQYNQKFCQACGAKTIVACEKCQSAIRGFDHDSILINVGTPPSYCNECGNAFPWQQARVNAEVELAAESEIVDQAALLAFRQFLGELGSETPRTELAVAKVKRFTASTGKTIGPLLTKMASDIATEAAKKHFGLP